MSEPKRLHPISAVYHFLKQLKEMIIPILVFFFLGGKGSTGELFSLFISIGAVLFMLIGGIISWLRFTYRIEGDELRIEYGIFIRKKRYIPFERIQSIDFSEGILHRPLGLVEVTVETAGSGGMGMNDAEAVLTAITKSEAEAIKEFLTSVRNSEKMESKEEMDEEMIYQISPKELFLLAATSGGVGVVISAVIAFLSQLEEIIPYEKIFSGFEHLIKNGILYIAILVFLGFLIAWIIAVIGMMIKYADFTVKKVNDEIVISRGLLEKRQITIPLHRIQAIKISENLIRQPLKIATVIIESAGGSSLNEERASVILLPIIKKEKIAGMLQPFFSDYDLLTDFKTAPKRALKRYLMRGWLLTVPFVILPIIFIRPFGYFSLLLIPAVSFWSFLKYKDAGWSVVNNQLSLRYRGISKNTVFMKKNKIQSLSVKESYFQRKKQLTTLDAVVKSGIGGSGGTVADLEQKDCYDVYRWYQGK
jgi:putative membrane protein